MKKFLIGLAQVVITVFIAVIAMLAIQHYVLPIQTDEDRVWEIADEVVSSHENPIFMTDSDAAAYYENLVDQTITDSIMVTIPRETYTQITTVLLGRDGECSPKSILMEYLKNNGTIYQYLKTDECPPDEKQIDEFTKAVKVDPGAELKPGDTVINGQLYRLQSDTVHKSH